MLPIVFADGQMELTNQDGEAMAIPPEDSAALMEGIMLHRKGLACLNLTVTASQEPNVSSLAASSSSQGKLPHEVSSAPTTAKKVGTIVTDAGSLTESSHADGDIEGLGAMIAGGHEEHKVNFTPKESSDGKQCIMDAMQVDPPTNEVVTEVAEPESRTDGANVAPAVGTAGKPESAVTPRDGDDHLGGDTETAGRSSKGKGKLKISEFP